MVFSIGFQSLLFWMLVGDCPLGKSFQNSLLSRFQSLLFWMLVGDTPITVDGMNPKYEFQSLLFWMLVGDPGFFLHLCKIVEVSILIILDVGWRRKRSNRKCRRYDQFQSLLFWMLVGDATSTILLHSLLICFNPYYSGCWLATVFLPVQCCM